MQDLGYFGEEPTWEKMELLERVGGSDHDDMSEKAQVKRA